MTRPSKFWRVAAALFVLLNIGGAGYAVTMGEPAHAVAHAVLLVGIYLGWLIGPWRQREHPPRAQVADARLDYLQQSVDAIALEVERLGEKQRFSEKLQAERGETPPLKKPPPEA